MMLWDLRGFFRPSLRVENPRDSESRKNRSVIVTMDKDLLQCMAFGVDVFNAENSGFRSVSRIVLVKSRMRVDTTVLQRGNEHKF